LPSLHPAVDAWESPSRWLESKRAAAAWQYRPQGILSNPAEVWGERCNVEPAVSEAQRSPVPTGLKSKRAAAAMAILSAGDFEVSRPSLTIATKNAIWKLSAGASKTLRPGWRTRLVFDSGRVFFGRGRAP